MTKYSIAKAQLAQAAQCAKNDDIEDSEVVEAIITLAVQDLSKTRGGDYARNFLQYELDSVRAGGVFEIQKR